MLVTTAGCIWAFSFASAMEDHVRQVQGNDRTVAADDATSNAGAKPLATAPLNPPKTLRSSWLDLTPELSGAYARWVKSPADRLGFWYTPDSEEVRARTGATAYSVHSTLRVAMDGPDGDRPVVVHDFRKPRDRVRMGFVADRPLAGVRLKASSAFGEAGAHVSLLRLDREGTELPLAEAVQTDARAEAWVTVSPGYAMPFGHYVVEVRSGQKPVEVWPRPAVRRTTWVEDPGATATRQEGIGLHATVSYADGTTESLCRDMRSMECISVGAFDPTLCGAKLGMGFGAGLGEHNNPFFIRYDDAFVRAHPSAFMAGATGDLIRTGEDRTPVPAVDDALLTLLADEQIRAGTRYYRGVSQLRYWVIGGEESYPDYFGLAPGDFRPDSIRHFQSFRITQGESNPLIPLVAESRNPNSRASRTHTPDDASPPWPSRFEPGTPDHNRWMEFREAAMNERASHYMQTFLSEDGARPVLYPTHGNPFFSWGRAAMGHDPGGIACSCDGFETGQITIDDDDEDLNLLTLSHLTAYGKLVVTPRLANKTLDPSARGGGRSFTPAMLRRLVMECVGMGVWHIGLVQWIGDLPDGEWHIRGTSAEDEARRVFSELRGAAPYLAGMSRLQPRVGLFVSDAAWRRDGWNPRWTGFFQDALDHQWQTTVVGDGLVGADLVAKMPVLICIDTETIARGTLGRIRRYLEVGGTLLVWGDFARWDEYGQAHPEENQFSVANHPGLVRIGSPSLDQRRTLLNRSSTPSGAHGESRDYVPVSFEEIERRVASVVPACVIRPIDVRSSGKPIRCLTLTDGETLIAVLINRETVPVKVSIRKNVADSRRAEGEWIYHRVAPGASAENPRTNGAWNSTLAPRGAALVWIHRRAAGPSTSGGTESLARARTALATFERLGCDCAHLDAWLKMAEDADGQGIADKCDAHVARIRESLGVQVEWRESDYGDLVFSAKVYGFQGDLVAKANVTATLAPGDGRAIAFRETSAGSYTATIPCEVRPLIYDVETGRYRGLDGATRVVVHARADNREGHAISTIDLGTPEGSLR